MRLFIWRIYAIRTWNHVCKFLDIIINVNSTIPTPSKHLYRKKRQIPLFLRGILFSSAFLTRLSQRTHWIMRAALWHSIKLVNACACWLLRLFQIFVWFDYSKSCCGSLCDQASAFSLSLYSPNPQCHRQRRTVPKMQPSPNFKSHQYPSGSVDFLVKLGRSSNLKFSFSRQSLYHRNVE